MTAPSFFKKLLNDPPPRWAFEVSETGLAFARLGRPPQTGFRPLEPDVVQVSPIHDNIQRPEALTALVHAVAPNGEKKRQRAAVILPDHSVRVSVIDFDSFPSDAEQQMSLVRFRIKKSLPFDIDSATVSYYPQVDGKRVDVVVTVAPLEILGHYEMPFRAAGLHPGLITTSTLCALELLRGDTAAVLAKKTGRILTLAITERGKLRLLRSIELTSGGVYEIASHLYPTFAYMEDQLGATPQQVLTCGLGSLNDQLAAELQQPCTPLRSSYGEPGEFNAGLLGYLESAKELQ